MKYPKMFLNAVIEMRAMKTIVATLTTLLILVVGTAQAATVGYWRFEEGSSDTLAAGTNSILDQTANSNDGTPYGDPFYRIDVPANPVPLTGDTNSLSLELNGNDYVSIPHSTSLDLTDAFTVEFWMKGSISQPSHLYLVIDKSHGWTDSTGWVFQGESSTGRLGFAVGNGGTTYNNFAGVGSITSLLDDTWHHIAGTFDSTDTGQEIKLYIDGVLDGTSASGPFATNTRNINIGASWGPGSFQRFFNGSVDEIRISDAVLTPSEFLIAPIPATFPLMGDTLKIPQSYEFSLEKYTQSESLIQLTNPTNKYQSASLEVINPHSDLTVSLTHQNPITIAPGEVQDIPIVLDAGSMPVRVYDDLLLKLTVENGEMLYSNIKITIMAQGTGLVLSFAIGLLFHLSPQGLAMSDSSVLIRNDRLSIHVQNAPLESLLRQIAEQAKISVVFYGSLNQAVSMEFEDLPVEKGLRRLLSKCNFSFMYQKESSPDSGKSIVLNKIVIISQDGSSEAVRFGPQPDVVLSISHKGPEKIYQAGHASVRDRQTCIPDDSKIDTNETPRAGNGIFVKADRNRFKELCQEDLHSQIETASVDFRLGLSGGPWISDGIDNPQEMVGVKITNISKESLLGQIGLEEDDVVQDINGKRIKEPGQVVEEIYKAMFRPGNGIIRIEVERDDIIEPIYVEIE